VGAFLDINPGMNRTGVSQVELERIIKLAKEIRASGIRFRGLHYYDGNSRDLDMRVRMVKAHAGYDRLLQIVQEMQSLSLSVEEVVTAGTPAFPCTLSYPEFETSSFLHRASPGTVIYGDVTSDSQLPAEYGYKWAALVLTRAVSYPVPDIVTCDGGHKAVSVDSGVPNCRVLGWDNLTPAHPSEEHLPISVASGTQGPSIGDLLYLVPKHVCPTVNNFSEALLIANGEIAELADVSARGHEPPLFDIRNQGETAGTKVRL
jgi:D-serine deaminase-like pyridoxal phosphate-dependent protein